MRSQPAVNTPKRTPSAHTPPVPKSHATPSMLHDRSFSRTPPPRSPLQAYVLEPAAAGLRPFAAYPIASAVLLCLLLLAAHASVYFQLHSDYCGFGAMCLAWILVATPIYPDRLLFSPPMLLTLTILTCLAKSYAPQLTFTFLGYMAAGGALARLILRHGTTFVLVLIFLALLVGAFYANQYHKEFSQYGHYTYVLSLLWGTAATYYKFSQYSYYTYMLPLLWGTAATYKSALRR